MRFKKAPLRAAGGKSNKSEGGGVVEATESNMSEAIEMEIDQKPPRGLHAHFLHGRPVKPSKGSAGPPPTQSYRRGSSYAHNKDEETQAAQAKLRQYEALGLIKVEVDEAREEQSSYVQPSEAMEEARMVLPQVAIPVSSVQNIGTTNGNLVFFTSNPPVVSAAQQQQMQPTPTVSQAGGIVDVPAMNDLEGEFGFSVTVEEKERTTKSPMWLMSNITKKLYTNINKAVPFEIRLKKTPRDQLFVRAVAVFSSAQFLRTNVTRCPNHASPTDVTNHDFPSTAHVVRADHPRAHYEKSPSGRLSVVVPLDILQDGSDYTPILIRFMCLGSCVGGINRRPIAIILTLENSEGQTMGRKVIDVRVCACPTRDIRTDEQAILNKGNKRRGSSLQEKSPSLMRKKPKTEPRSEDSDDDKVYRIPVRGKQLFDFMMQMKGVYYKTHPEYADRYPDDCSSFQVEEDSEDDLKGNTLQRIGVGDSETTNWDSGGDSPQGNTFGNELQLETFSGTKHNSPLSKLTPNISISPSSFQLRLWRDDHDTGAVGFSRGECLEYPTMSRAQASDIITGSQSSSNFVNTETITSKSFVTQNQVIKNTDSTPKHIMVKQVQSYKSGGLTVKTKPIPLSNRPIHIQNGEDRINRSKEKRYARDNMKYSLDPTEISCSQNTGEDYMSPGSPEMLAANVLVEGFKSNMVSNQ